MHSGSEISAAHRWLAERGVTGIVRFPVQGFGSDNAPQRRAMRGTPMPVWGRHLSSLRNPKSQGLELASCCALDRAALHRGWASSVNAITRTISHRSPVIMAPVRIGTEMDDIAQ